MDFNEIFKELQKEIKNYAKAELKDYKKAALKDAKNFLKATKNDLERWTLEYAQGKLTKENLESLIAGQKELAEMVMLKQQGLALIRLDKFKEGLNNTVINTILKLL